MNKLEDWEKLVKNLEKYAQNKPDSYKLRVGLLALLGYVYIFVVLAGLLLLIALLVILVLYSHHVNFVIVKLLILFFIPIVIILRSLWVSFPPPKGFNLQRQKVPHLFALLDKLITKLQTPKLDRVILTFEFNAAIVQVPRFGLLGLGWQQNFLVIGLPLLNGLSSEEFSAVIAHELGHLSGNHSRFAGWVYRVRQTWEQILVRLQQNDQRNGAILFSSFFNWYTPFFNAYSFVLARTNEYEADRCAAFLVGAEATAAALVNSAIKSQFLDQSFWQNLVQQAGEQPEPPSNTFSNLAEVLKGEIAPEKKAKWLQQSLSQQTDLGDTHPCLRDRLLALGITPENAASLLQPIELTAAQEFLGDFLPDITTQFNQDWKTEANFTWHEQYNYIQQVRKNLQALDSKIKDGNKLDIDEQWERTKFILELQGSQATLPLLRDILEQDRDHVSANFLLGSILIEGEDESGIYYLEKAMARDMDVILSGCELIYDFLNQKQRPTEAQQYKTRYIEHYELLNLAKQERSYVSDRDRFHSHHLSDKEIALLRENFANYPEIKEAYLVEKTVEYFPENPFYVLGIIRKRSGFELDEQGQDKKFFDRLIEELPSPGKYTWIVMLNSYNQKLAKILKQTLNSLIYP